LKFKQAVVTGIGVAPQNERRSIRELRIRQSVDGKVEDSEIAEGLGFELRFCCVRAEERHAAVRVIERLFGRYHLLARRGKPVEMDSRLRGNDEPG
jgi:hypothetical protein